MKQMTPQVKNQNKIFAKAKSQALAVLAKNPSDSEWYQDQVIKVESLESFPTPKTDLRYVDVAAKAKLLKAHLQSKYPENKFSVKIERYSGGSSINASYKGEKIDSQELREMEWCYSDAGKTDSQSDYYDYDNYVNIDEDSEQYIKRYQTFESCNFCGCKAEVLAINTENKKSCNVCTNNNSAGNSFRVLPRKWI